MDLTSNYLGLRLTHPIVASASPYTSNFDGMRRLEDAGAAAVVMASLYEEQVRAEDTAYALFTEHGSFSQAEAGTYFPELPDYNRGVSGHLETLRRAAEALSIPVVASLNGTSREGWPEYAKLLEEAGAAALELNLFLVPVDVTMSAAQVESKYLEVVRSVKGAVRIPVSLKLSPFFSAMGHLAVQLQNGGADGLVLFNRFYRRDIDLETLDFKLETKLSTPAEIHLPLVWIALLSRQVKMSLGATSGVDSYEQVVKYLLAGADVVMTTSALLRHGPGHLQTLRSGLEGWLKENGFASVEAIRGLRDATHWDQPAELLRADYVKSLTNYVPKRLIA